MNYARIITRDIANGPGVRTTLFVSGCTHHCPGCFNEVAWDFSYGRAFTEDTIQHILNLLMPNYVAGLTLLGGEPFEPQNQPALLELVKRIKTMYPEKTIWAYSGFLFEDDILAGKLGDPAITHELLRHIDVLVDGPFIQNRHKLGLRFRGSDNQRIINVQESLAKNETVLWNDWQK
mgnify:CR=1 FL=1